MRSFLVFILLLSISGRSLAKTRKPNVVQMYKQAMTLYDAKKYPEAYTAYFRILQTYPAYEPARIFLARTLYHLGQYSESLETFKGLNPAGFDIETSYEFGRVHFQLEFWEPALFALSRVPKGHALHDLASYYGGVAAFKLRKYEEAEALIDQAVVLPKKLSDLRLEYKKAIASIVKERKKAEIKQQQVADIQEARRKVVEAPLATPVARRNTRVAKPLKGAAEKKRTNTIVSKTPEEAPNKLAEEPPPVTETTEAQEKKSSTPFSGRSGAAIKVLSEDHDYRGTRSDHIKVHSNILFSDLSIQQKVSENQLPSWQLGPRIEIESREFRGAESADPWEEKDFVKSLVHSEGSGRDSLGTLGFEGLFRLGVNETFFLGAEGNYYSAMLNFSSKKNASQLGGKGFLQVLAPVKTLFEVGARSFKNKDQKNELDMNLSTISFEGSPVVDLGLGFRVNYFGYSYYEDQAEGPDQDILVSVWVEQSLPAELKLLGSVSFQQSKNYRYFQLGVVDLLSAQEDLVHAEAALVWQPLPWLEFEVLGQRVQRAFSNLSLDGEDIEIALEAYRPTFESKTELKLAAFVEF